MGKKKAIKLATATAIAASAFVAVAPTQSEAATSSVDKAITKATNQMAKAYDTYHKAAKNEGKLPATGTIRNQVKLANDYYTAATKEIAKNGGSKTQKAAYTKKLEAKKYFLDRAEAYLAAVNTNLNPAKTAFNEAVEGGKQKTVLAAQKAYNEAIKGFEAKVDKIYGPDARNLLKEKYAAPAHKLADSVNDEMTVYNAYKKIEGEKLIEKDLEAAKKLIDSVKAEVAKLKEKETKLAKNILVAVEKNDKAYEDALVPVVKEVSAINSKEIVVEFESEIDKVSAETEANYSLKVAGVTETGFTAKVDEDNAKKVVLTLTDAAKLANNEAIQFTVKKEVLSKNLKAGKEDYSKTWVFADNTAPVIKEVVKDGNDVKVTFDDYVSAVNLAKVAGVDKTSSIAPITVLTKTITITNGAANLATGTNSVLLSGVTDAAGNKSSVLNGSFVVSDDTVAPTVSKIEQIDDNKLKVTFNKNVTTTASSFVVKKNGYALTATPTGSGKEYEITLAANGDIAVYDAGQDTSNVTVEVKDYKGVANNLYGNAHTQNFTLSKDKVAPTVVNRFNQISDVGTAPAVDERFDIQFSEELDSSVDLTKLTLTDKDGVRQAITGAAVVNDASGKATILRVNSTAVKTSGAINVGNYTVNVAAGAVKDKVLNSNTATSVSFTKTTATADVTANATAAANVITVNYNAAMTTSATTLSNYQLDGKELPAGSNIYFDGATQKVVIELPADSIKSTGGAVLTIADTIVSTSGKKVAVADRTQNITTGFVDNVKPVLTSAKKESATSVELTFSEAVDGTTADMGDFVVKINGTTVAYTAVVDGVVNDKKISLTVPTYNTAQTITVQVTDTESNISLVDLSTNKLTKSTLVTAN